MDNKIFSKVFIWLFIGLMVTFLTGFIVSVNANMLYNVFLKYFTFIILAEIGLAIFFSLRITKMSYLTAVITYLLYTLLTGLTFGSIFVIYDMASIIQVFGITSLLMLVMGLIGFYTDVDLSRFRNILFIGLLFIIVVGIINIFLGNIMIDFSITIFGIILFLGFIAYDIQKIKVKLSTIESKNIAVYGSFMLYLDFINLFIRLLSLMGKRRD